VVVVYITPSQKNGIVGVALWCAPLSYIIDVAVLAELEIRRGFKFALAVSATYWFHHHRDGFVNPYRLIDNHYDIRHSAYPTSPPILNSFYRRF
jgi:hypothetical protein